MPREKVSGETRFPFEWTESLSQDDAIQVLRAFTTLVERHKFSGHAKIGESNLLLGPNFDSNLGRVEALGGPESIDFVIATDLEKASLFADFDAGRLEVRTQSRPLLDELVKYFQKESLTEVAEVDEEEFRRLQER